ncbi:hypothetical protein [Autumnicola edwardsiae]|uniref:Uncharacterized protein n=1 Tax=Autumnicola edwardsiae TaxID=3075594 RepID=A0ABU3CW42_9FLAO|nr:hypothetical protein [Zunongwangia sp. F297]MDT0650584.1 hypothetical protein [Zunongwangia sp. F297]
MIEIQNVKTKTSVDILTLLLKEKKSEISIYFPKYTVLFSSANENIADDYARLIYVGYKLQECSKKVEYEVIEPHQHESVLFTIVPKDLQMLSETLLELSYLYENEPEEDNFYFEDVYQYLSDVDEGKAKVVCEEYLNMYKEFNSK